MIYAGVIVGVFLRYWVGPKVRVAWIMRRYETGRLTANQQKGTT